MTASAPISSSSSTVRRSTSCTSTFATARPTPRAVCCANPGPRATCRRGSAIENNRAVKILSSGPESEAEAERLAAEPARGNLAELGLGVLADFGVTPIGEVLLDEKLGLHLAFGRSEHFGGQVGPANFSRPEAVMHQDHVYLNELQPRVNAARVVLTRTDGETLDLIRDGEYVIGFS